MSSLMDALTRDQLDALKAIAAERGASVEEIVGEAVRFYVNVMNERARFYDALEWTLEEHHDVLEKLGQ